MMDEFKKLPLNKGFQKALLVSLIVLVIFLLYLAFIGYPQTQERNQQIRKLDQTSSSQLN